METAVLLLQHCTNPFQSYQTEKGNDKIPIISLKDCDSHSCENMKILRRYGRRYEGKGQQKSDRCRVNTMGVWRSLPGPTAAKRRTARSLGARGLLKMMLKERIMEMSCYSSSGLPYYQRLSPFALKLQVASSLLPLLLPSFSYLLIHS